MARRHATATVSELDGNTCMNRCPEFELRTGPLLLLESINRRLHVSLQRTVSYTGQSRIPFQTLKMNPRKHTPRNEQQMQKYWGEGMFIEVGLSLESILKTVLCCVAYFQNTFK